jgi:two-component system, NarL family, sensor histidine kinase UhpB
MVSETEQTSIGHFFGRLIQDFDPSNTDSEIYRMLVENSHDIIYTLTADGIFSFVSPVWTELLGHPVSEVVGKSFRNFVHPDDVPDCLVWLHKVIETGQRQEGIEYRVQHLDGTWLLHTSSAVPFFDETNNTAGFYGIAADITEKKRALEEKLALEQLQLLAQHTETARESERESISRDLHDELGQALTAIKIHLGFISQSVSDVTVVSKINKVTSMVSEAITSVKRITAKLRPEILDELGLEATIRWYAKEFAEINRVAINLTIQPGIALPIDFSVTVFRIVQEALTNISRHAGATRVYIGLSETNDSIKLRISDNGSGITKDDIESKTSWGIISMKERAKSLGGTFDIYSEPGAGTVIKIVFPVIQ